MANDNLLNHTDVGAHDLKLVDRATLKVVCTRLQLSRADERL